MRRREVLAGGLAAASVPAGVSTAGHAQERRVRLANADWAVSIVPATLEIVVEAGGRSVVVSRGADPRDVSALTQGEDRLRWTWGDQFDVVCSLAGPDLAIEVTSRSPATVVLVDQPAAAMGEGMMLAFGEGYHVAADDAAWRDFLVNRRSELDAAEDLTLPLWGTDHGGFTLHWIATNPFNTLLRFHAEEGGLGARLEHRFTALAPDTPMTLMLHLAGDDLLAGAKRYRRQLVESGAWRSLAAKIERTPSTARLIGATHVYLWGNGLIGDKDVTDWPAWLAALKGDSALATALRGELDSEARAMLAALPAAPPPWQRLAVLRAFNAAVLGLARKRWQLATVDPDALVAAHVALRAEVVRTFGKALARDVASWGDGLSKATMAKLRAAGLDRLWIGLGDGWEGGLWHPEAVRFAAEAGYLIGPYDSYETAIPPGERPDWATAQLGHAAYDDCAIVQEDGSLRAGFGKAGHYTSTACVTPILKERIPAIAKAAGFNSWFVDVYASGMVFDDYRPGRRSTKAENAVANIAACRWISEALQLPTGSEDGRATVADGVVFAHGIETPVMGWGDPDLQKNAGSPFFLGGWYPPEAPTLFFKQAPLKEPYRTIYLSPRTRLPLYQAAFHGSMIASHHWLFDQLKIANAMADRAIAQQLYNVPALFHLSAATLAERLPAVLRHDAFFRPVHAQLAGKTLERFDWLSDDRLVQQTRFSDGTRLIANFDTVARHAGEVALPPQSVVAIGVGDGPLRFSA